MFPAGDTFKFDLTIYNGDDDDTSVAVTVRVTTLLDVQSCPLQNNATLENEGGQAPRRGGLVGCAQRKPLLERRGCGWWWSFLSRSIACLPKDYGGCHTNMRWRYPGPYRS